MNNEFKSLVDKHENDKNEWISQNEILVKNFDELSQSFHNEFDLLKCDFTDHTFLLKHSNIKE